MGYTKAIKGKLYKYFTQRLDLKPSTKGFLRGNCPYCGGKFSFGINIEKSKVKCFRECGHDTNPTQVLMFLENFQEVNQVRNFLAVQAEYDSYESTQYIKPKTVEMMALPEEYMLITSGDSLLGRAARNYMRGRGFKLMTLVMLGVGYCIEGPYAGYIIFPFYERGVLKFYQGRRFSGSGPKMQNPLQEKFGVGKTQLLFNQDALYMHNRIRLVESITNALTLGDTAVASLGKKLSSYQKTQILKSPCEYIDIILDPDAIKDSILLAMDLCNYKKVRLVYWPGTQDVNDLGKKETLARIKQFRYEGYSYYNKLRLNPPKL